MASVSKVIHTDSQLHAEQFGKTAYTEWIRYTAVNRKAFPIQVTRVCTH